VSEIPLSSTTTSATTTTTSANSVTTENYADGHGKRLVFYEAKSGNGSYEIAAALGITLDQFYAWNPAVGPWTNFGQGSITASARKGHERNVLFVFHCTLECLVSDIINTLDRSNPVPNILRISCPITLPKTVWPAVILYEYLLHLIALPT